MLGVKSGHVRVLDTSDGHVLGTDQRAQHRIRGMSVHDSQLWTCDESGQLTASHVLTPHEHSTRANITQTNQRKGAAVVDKWLANTAHSRAVVISKGHVPSVWSLEHVTAGQYQPVWSAKNVGNDWLDVNVALNDSDVTWVDDTTHQFIVSTLTGQIRTYDTRAQRRPVADWALGASRADRSAGPDSMRDQFPLSMVRWSTHHAAQVVVADPLGNVWVCDRREGRAESIDHRKALSYHKGGWKRGPCAQVVARLEGLVGAARDIQWSADGEHLAAVGLDRFIHIWKSGSYTSVGTIYTKLRLNRVLFMHHTEPVAQEEPQEQAEEPAEGKGLALFGNMNLCKHTLTRVTLEVELWESMGVIDDNSKKRKRKSAQRNEQAPAKKQRVDVSVKNKNKRKVAEDSDDEDESFMFNQMSSNNNNSDEVDDDEDLPVQQLKKKKKSFKKFVPVRKNK